jgi:pimeloyl-ACP methyl ester carboxylesterase
MRHDVTIVGGDIKRPAIVFIHGLGMDKRIWEAPDESRIFGGRFPVSLLLCREPLESEIDANASKRLFFGTPMKNLTTLFHDLRGKGCTVIAWSQQRPSAEIGIAVSELKNIITMYRNYCESGIVLIGHSRGGLVARKYLAQGDKRVKAVITLATPHTGSRMAQWVEYMAPLASLLYPLIPDSEKGTLTHTVKKVFDFLKSKAVRELLPDSPFFQSLDDDRVNGVHYLSLGGKDPTLFSVYKRGAERIIGGGQPEMHSIRIQRVFSVPEIFTRFIPERFFPDEMKKGKGDGLVSTESSRLPWADNHADFPVNHAEILFDERVRAVVMDTVTASGKPCF